MKASQNERLKDRLMSLDVFRGITVAAMIIVNTPGDWNQVYEPLEHSKWNGCTPTDIVFPSFLFMVGISIAFSLESKRALIHEHGKIMLKALRRMLLLIAFGLSIQLVYHFDFYNLRFPGVLQRIGVVYFISVFLFLKVSDRVLMYVFALLLVGYYLLMAFIPVPGEIISSLNPDNNWVSYIDNLIFTSHHLYRFAKTDPCGLLSTLPAIASTLYGIFVGQWIKRTDVNHQNKVKALFLAGFIFNVLGLITDLFFPINKALWTSSYVLYTSGICTICLTICYWLIDVKGYKKGWWPFLVFGSNALAAYILSEVLPALIDIFKYHDDGRAVSGMKVLYAVVYSMLFLPRVASLLSAVSFTILIWLIMLIFYKRKIIIKI
jgi:predicted acyltransferase